MASPTFETMPTKTEIPPTSTSTSIPFPVVQSIEPTPDPFSFLFEKFEMKTEVVGWGTMSIMDESGGFQEKLLHTSDGGITWLDVTPPYNDPYLSIDDFNFLDGEHAWIVNASQAADGSNYFPIIWRTIDGGATWERTETPISYPWAPAGGYSISFKDEQHGSLEVTTNVAAGTSWYSELETSDGGKHWKQLPDATLSIFDQTELLSTLPTPQGINLSGGCWDYRMSQSVMSDSESILQILCSGNMLIYHSHDGGKTWNPPLVTGPLLLTSLVDFIDVDTGWYRGIVDDPSNPQGVRLYITHDGGATWSRIDPTVNIENLDPDQIPNGNIMELIYDINFFDSETGIARSDYWYDYSLMLKTTDGGLTWSSWVPHWQPAKQ